ncbi:MAG: hypothetical protein H8E40_07850 [Chloroflexi bacterium]|nr:hypothetical protein [Chloroflexota bacterium]
MFKTKLSIAIALVAALLLAPAAYAAEGTTTGSFGASGLPPTVDAIGIYTDIGCTLPATDMNPQTEYYCKVTVGSINKLKHLSTVKVTLFYDSGGDPVAPIIPDTQTCAILTCTVDPLAWAMLPTGGSTTWSIDSGDCSQPADLNATTGDWIFAFTPGKVATESIAPAYWDAQGLATNKTAQTGELYDRDTAMNWFGEITVNTASVNWGAVPLGLVFENATYNPETGIDVNYIANGDYEEDIKSTDWVGAVSLDTVTLDVTGGNPPAALPTVSLPSRLMTPATMLLQLLPPTPIML